MTANILQVLSALASALGKTLYNADAADLPYATDYITYKVVSISKEAPRTQTVTRTEDTSASDESVIVSTTSRFTYSVDVSIFQELSTSIPDLVAAELEWVDGSACRTLCDSLGLSLRRANEAQNKASYLTVNHNNYYYRWFNRYTLNIVFSADETSTAGIGSIDIPGTISDLKYNI